MEAEHDEIKTSKQSQRIVDDVSALAGSSMYRHSDDRDRSGDDNESNDNEDHEDSHDQRNSFAGIRSEHDSDDGNLGSIKYEVDDNFLDDYTAELDNSFDDNFEDHLIDDQDNEADRDQVDNTVLNQPEKYKFTIQNGIVVSRSEIEYGREQFDGIDRDESYVIQNDVIVKTEIKKYGTQSTTYADADGDGVYSVVDHVWKKHAGQSGPDVNEFDDWYEHDGNFDEYEIQVSGKNVELFDKETQQLVLSFDNADRVILNDKGFATEQDINAMKAYRIYQAAFDRDPVQGDTRGLGYWVSQIDNGMDVVEVAARFIDSPEFRATYGNAADNATFLSKLYENILNRTPDAVGYQWWLNELNSNPDRNWAVVLAEFSESRENQVNVAAIVGEGIVFDLAI